MGETLRLAVVGVGRIGRYHARRAVELAADDGKPNLVAVVDSFEDLAERVAGELQARKGSPIRPFRSVAELVDARLIDASVIASRTEDHQADARALIDAGHRVMLEKPLAHTVAAAADLVDYLASDEWRAGALMQTFMRRFDAPLRYGKSLLDGGRIGRPFKVTSVLEEPVPTPVGYNSPGILPDMAMHNIDEAMWLLSQRPEALSAWGANLHNFRISPVEEDFDDASLQMWFQDGLVSQVVVSRNHVAGYRNETWIHGEKEMVHVGRFEGDPAQVAMAAYGREGAIERKTLETRDYGEDAPVFMARFGEAYKQELAYFIDKCLGGALFCVNQDDGLRAMEIAETGARALQAGQDGLRISYHR